MPNDRERLRRTFDAAADDYQRARPEYPEELFDALISATGISTASRILEIGPATGKATLPLARRGFTVTGIELGAALAAAARRNLTAFPKIDIVEGSFDTWRPDEQFDLVFAATAWHWLDPLTRYQRAWQVLRPGGHLAFWSATHVFPVDGDPFFVEIQQIYDEIGERLPEGVLRPRPGELPDQRGEIAGSGLFGDVVVRHVDWVVDYTADEYLALLDTFSGHIAMRPWQRDRLYTAIRRRLAGRPDGRLRRGWGAVLHIARRPITS